MNTLIVSLLMGLYIIIAGPNVLDALNPKWKSILKRKLYIFFYFLDVILLFTLKQLKISGNHNETVPHKQKKTNESRTLSDKEFKTEADIMNYAKQLLTADPYLTSMQLELMINKEIKDNLALIPSKKKNAKSHQFFQKF